uniref:Uncharacterized protein n=1 Tax=Rhizophora mucronata TaxID=61149 RepID=A0A2P2LYX5_RHIMU
MKPRFILTTLQYPGQKLILQVYLRHNINIM